MSTGLVNSRAYVSFKHQKNFRPSSGALISGKWPSIWSFRSLLWTLPETPNWHGRFDYNFVKSDNLNTELTLLSSLLSSVHETSWANTMLCTCALLFDSVTLLFLSAEPVWFYKALKHLAWYFAFWATSHLLLEALADQTCLVLGHIFSYSIT